MKPTYLYIKFHKSTGKYYFGKTVQKDPVKYLGSGLHWRRHLKVHGKDGVETIWFKLFHDKEELTRVALEFSEKMDIQRSEMWLNMRPENGLDGGGRDGSTHSLETRKKMSLVKMGKSHSPETVAKRAASLRGRKLSESHRRKMSELKTGSSLSVEHRRKISEGLLGRVRPKACCPHCGKVGATASLRRYHFEKCKSLDK